MNQKLSKIAIGLVVVGLLAFGALVSPSRPASAITPSGNPLFKSGTITCATTATLIPPVPTSGRQRLLIDNRDAASIFIGDAAVTVSGAGRGITVATNTLLPLPLDVGYAPVFGPATPAGGVYCISAAGTAANAVSWVEIR